MTAYSGAQAAGNSHQRRLARRAAERQVKRIENRNLSRESRLTHSDVARLMAGPVKSRKATKLTSIQTNSEGRKSEWSMPQTNRPCSTPTIAAWDKTVSTHG